MGWLEKVGRVLPAAAVSRPLCRKKTAIRKRGGMSQGLGTSLSLTMAGSIISDHRDLIKRGRQQPFYSHRRHKTKMARCRLQPTENG